MTKHKIAISITGASGSIYAKILLDKLCNMHNQIDEVALVMSNNAKQVWKIELGNDDYKTYPVTFYDTNNFMAPFASGSSSYSVLIICPCSMGTIGRIAAGISNDLTSRAADVMLKEKRKLILVPRETPYNLIHLQNMKTVTLAGGIVCPASPSFYHNPKTIEEAVSTVVDRILILSGLEVNTKRWQE